MMHNVFDEIYLQYRDKVFSYVKARIFDRGEAEDITADIFLKVISAYDSYDSEKSMLSTWIYTIAANTLRDYMRRTAVRAKYSTDVEEEYLEALVVSEDNCLDSLLNEEMLDLLADALSALPEHERMIVVMHYYNNVPHKEIANHLGLTYANVRFLNHRALEKIRTFFTAWGY